MWSSISEFTNSYINLNPANLLPSLEDIKDRLGLGSESFDSELREIVFSTTVDPLPNNSGTLFRPTAPPIGTQAVHQVSIETIKVQTTATANKSVTVVQTANKVTNAADKALDKPMPKLILPLPSGSVSIMHKNFPGFVAFISFMFWLIVTSKEKILQNVDLEIMATQHPKAYRIGWGIKGGTEHTITIEVQKGKPVLFLHQKELDITTEKFQTIFKPKKTVSNTLGPFQWKRQEPHTQLYIIIHDPGNAALQNGPIAHHIKLGEFEAFNIIHLDPEKNKPEDIAYDVTPAESSDWTKLKKVHLQMADPLSDKPEHSCQNYTLPFDDERHYLTITHIL